MQIGGPLINRPMCEDVSSCHVLRSSTVSAADVSYWPDAVSPRLFVGEAPSVAEPIAGGGLVAEYAIAATGSGAATATFIGFAGAPSRGYEVGAMGLFVGD